MRWFWGVLGSVIAAGCSRSNGDTSAPATRDAGAFDTATAITDAANKALDDTDAP